MLHRAVTSLVRRAGALHHTARRSISKSSARLSEMPEMRYRASYWSDMPKTETRVADTIMTMFWYWFLYHCVYDYEHLIGDGTYPDASKWTDEELGIPPDDIDLTGSVERRSCID